MVIPSGASRSCGSDCYETIDLKKEKGRWGLILFDGEIPYKTAEQ